MKVGLKVENSNQGLFHLQDIPEKKLGVLIGVASQQ
jgi:hypothetical protein